MDSSLGSRHRFRGLPGQGAEAGEGEDGQTRQQYRAGDVRDAGLYHHVRDKDDLLIQLLDYYASRLKRPEPPEDPRERVIAAATVMHDSLAAWPEAVEVLTADDLLGESALWMVEEMVGGAIAYGRTPEQAVELYRNIWYYTVGEIFVRVRAARRGGEDRPRYRDTVFGKLDESRFPSLAAVGERWPELAARDTFAAGLRAFVDEMLAQESR
jgi:AcrR family transcriptional regulator